MRPSKFFAIPSANFLTELLFGASIMALAWSLRGQFGHLKGALIPGACAAILLVFVLAEKGVLSNRPWIYILGPIGFSAGGHMGYGKLVESLIHSSAFPPLSEWLQIFIIGALWASIGLACLAFAMRRSDLSVLDAGIITVVFAIWIVFLGVLNWETYDRLLFGCGLGAFILYGVWIRSRRIVFRWALSGFLIGGFAFAGAVLLLRHGENGVLGNGWPWWRLRDQWIGALVGLGLVMLARRANFKIQQDENPHPVLGGKLRLSFLFFFGGIPLLNLTPTFGEWFMDYSLAPFGWAGMLVMVSVIVTGWLIRQVVLQTRKLSGFPKEEVLKRCLILWIGLLIFVAIAKSVCVRGWGIWEDAFTLFPILGAIVSILLKTRKLTR